MPVSVRLLIQGAVVIFVLTVWPPIARAPKAGMPQVVVSLP